MTFLPIVQRELRAGARRPGAHWLCFSSAAAACGIWLLLLSTRKGAVSPSQMAVTLFWSVTIVVFAFCQFAGLFLTADCISVEKRNGTLGLLFLTDLKGHDVVLGKLASTSLHAVYGVLGVLPMLALSLLLGGVAVGQFWRTAGVLLATLMLSLAIGLAVSVFCREALEALIGTLVVILGLLVGPVLLNVLAHALGPGSTAAGELARTLSPVSGLVLARDANFNSSGGAARFWFFLAVQFALCIAALAVASVRVARTWFEGQGTAGEAAGVWTRRLRFGDATFRERRRATLESNPFLWLALRDRLPRAAIETVMLLLFAIWLSFVISTFATRGNAREVCFGVVMFMAFGMHVVWKILVAIEASRRFSEDRQSGALELLLVTPLGVGRMLKGQWLALRKTFLRTAVLLTMMNLGIIGIILGPDPVRMGKEAGLFTFILSVGAVLLWTDYAALTQSAMWAALRTRHPARAVLNSIGRIMFVPWAGLLLLYFIAMGSRGISEDAIYAIVFVWWIGAMIVDGVALAVARSQLGANFRKAVSGDAVASGPARDPALAHKSLPRP